LQLKRLVRRAGGSNLRVFGSVATGADHHGSDIDLLFAMGKPLSLMQLGALERDARAVLGVQVDLLPDSALRPDLRDRIMAEAVPL
jgi:predicted nucleotidyltransferase